jgi:Fic-DOC domain mobile mystery protein B
MGSDPSGTTPLDPDEAEGLLHFHVSTREELNELEEANIQLGLEWGQHRAVMARRPEDALTEDFLFELHRRMFNEVWEWAGRVRQTNKNLGVDKAEIRPEVRKLVADARFWRENGTFPPDELAVRFHHRLVYVHPFPNGNGRHARMMADLVVQQLGRRPFSWGSQSLTSTPELRARYISALQEADRGDLASLVRFART